MNCEVETLVYNFFWPLVVRALRNFFIVWQLGGLGGTLAISSPSGVRGGALKVIAFGGPFACSRRGGGQILDLPGGAQFQRLSKMASGMPK